MHDLLYVIIKVNSFLKINSCLRHLKTLREFDLYKIQMYKSSFMEKFLEEMFDFSINNIFMGCNKVADYLASILILFFWSPF